MCIPNDNISYPPIAAKHIIWIDETNFNMFIRRTNGWSKKGQRSVSLLPSSKGKNIHVIGAISSFGVELMELRRGSYRWESANQWLSLLIDTVVGRGVPVNHIVVVCDNAPVHSRLSLVAEEKGFTLLRLGPYSPMLNPIENIWSVIKAAVKRNNRVPVVTYPGVVEQRMRYLEEIITSALTEATPYLCSQAIVHSNSFHRRALALEDMLVGA